MVESVGKYQSMISFIKLSYIGKSGDQMHQWLHQMIRIKNPKMIENSLLTVRNPKVFDQKLFVL